MACKGGKCWITTYRVRYQVFKAKFVGNCVDHGLDVPIGVSSRDVAMDGLDAELARQYLPGDTCESGCKCQPIVGAQPVDTQRTLTQQGEYVHVHDSDAGRCIIVLTYTYQIYSSRIEGTCIQPKVLPQRKMPEIPEKAKWQEMDIEREEFEAGRANERIQDAIENETAEAEGALK